MTLDVGTARVNEWRVIRSEWIKFRSVRSSVIAVIAAALVAIAFGALFASFADNGGPGGPGGGPGAGGQAGMVTDSLSLSLAGFNLAQMILGIVGVLMATSEYSTGTIRATFAAVPNRLRVLRSKAVVVGCVTLVVATIAAFLAFFAGHATYTGSTLIDIGDGDTVRTLLGMGLYCPGIAVIGVALGFLIRSSAGAIGTLLALLLLAPGLVGLLPDSVSDFVGKILPSNAGGAFASSGIGMGADAATMSPQVGLVVFLLWIIGLLAIAGVGDA